MTVTRVVIVEFWPEVTAQEVSEFAGWLRELALHTSGLVRMTCGEHWGVPSEAGFSANAPNVTFGHFMSVWEFSNGQAVEEFVLNPLHREMAGKKFRQLVKHRYVSNIAL